MRYMQFDSSFIFYLFLFFFSQSSHIQVSGTVNGLQYNYKLDTEVDVVSYAWCAECTKFICKTFLFAAFNWFCVSKHTSGSRLFNVGNLCSLSAHAKNLCNSGVFSERHCVLAIIQNTIHTGYLAC